MTWAISIYALPYVAALLLTGVSIAHVWRNRQIAPSKYELLFMSAGAELMLSAFFRLSTDDLPAKILFSKIQYAGIVVVPIAVFLYILQYSGNTKWLNTRTTILVSIVPALTMFLVATNDLHHLFWRTISLNVDDPFLPLDYVYGAGFWVWFSYVLWLLLAIGFLLIVLLIRSNNLYRRQVIALLVLTFVPGVSGLFSSVKIPPYPYFDPSSLAFSLTFVFVAFSIFKMRLGDIIPVAREVVVESMSDGVIVLDGQNRIVDLNPVAQYVIGISTSDLIGHRIDKVWTSWPSQIGKLYDEIEIGREVLLDTWYGRRTFDMLVSPIIDWRGHLNSRVVVLHDVTDRKLVEDELRHRSERLEALVEEKTRQLRAAERMAGIGETASMVGHDLRNPLQTVVNLLYLANNKLSMNLTESDYNGLKNILTQLEKQTEYMDKIVSDLQDYSKPMSVQPVLTKIRPLIEDTVSAISIPESVKVVIEVAKGSNPVMLDPALTKRVLTNLVINAVQAMPNGGLLSITASRKDRDLLLTVSDTGVGIPEENLEKIFHPLFTTKAKGQGFGLAVCKRIVEAHGGHILVESTVGKGSSFIIKIPVTKDSADQ